MLKTMLSASPELDFVDELFLICPRWLHKDLQTNIREHVGDLRAPGALPKLLDLLYSGVPYGWFWSVVDEQLDRELLESELRTRDLDLRSIFDSIMTAHAAMRGKSGRGAKFPLHYSQVERLLEWFPDCKLVHTTRDPRAVYASQSVKYLQKDDGPAKVVFEKFRQFVHINIQSAWTARVHRRLAGLDNYRLLRYEDIVRDTEAEIRGLCEFLGVEMYDAMLKPHQYGSSFDAIGAATGVDASSLERWRSTIAPTTAVLINLFQYGPRRTLGYAE